MKRPILINKEEWRITTISSQHAVSNYGRIKRLAGYDRAGRWRRERILIARDAQTQIVDDEGELILIQVARLILEAFVEPPPLESSVARHLDDDRTNNMVSNLAWGSQQENILDAIRNNKFGAKGRIYSIEEKKNRSLSQIGRKHSSETREKMSQSNRVRMAIRKAAGLLKKPAGLTFAGFHHSEEFKNKASKRMLGNTQATGRVWINNGIQNRRIFPFEIIPEGWVQGYLRKQK